MQPVSVLDAAEAVLRTGGPMTAMKLQKLVYYCQAWSLVWDESPLFEERIEAWANGPVVRELYEAHRGSYIVHTVGGNADRLDKDQRETVEAVWAAYGGRSSQWLSDLTHQEDPWRMARQGVEDGRRSDREITHAAMAEYYDSL